MAALFYLVPDNGGADPHKRLLNRALSFAFASVWILRGAWRYLANW